MESLFTRKSALP